MRLFPALAAVALASAQAATAQAAPAAAYTVTHSVPLGGPDRWDYVVYDSVSGRVFVAHGDRVDVVDGATGALVGHVSGMTGGSHGVATSAATGKGYTDDGQAGTIAAFDLKSLKTVQTIKGQEDADGIVLDPSSGHVFVINGDSKSLTVIDPATDTVLATIDGAGGLEYAVADGAGKLYVNGAEKREMLRIDTATDRIDARWPLADCVGAHGLAMDTVAHRLFASCANRRLVVMNSDNGAVVGLLPIGQGSDAVAFDPLRKLVFSSNGEGDLSVFRETGPDAYEALPPIKTAVTGRTMSLNPKTGRLYVAAADIDPQAPIPPRPDGRPGRAKPLPGSLKLLFLDPSDGLADTARTPAAP